MDRLRPPPPLPPPGAPVGSPCVNVCRLDAGTGWCVGCRRNLDEIAAWSRLDEAARRAVWQQLAQRRLPGDAVGGREPRP